MRPIYKICHFDKISNYMVARKENIYNKCKCHKCIKRDMAFSLQRSMNPKRTFAQYTYSKQAQDDSHQHRRLLALNPIHSI